MEEMEDNMSAEDIKEMDNFLYKLKPKKRSLVERELETNLTERITSPIIISDSTNTSRYGRARRFMTDSDNNQIEKANSNKSSEKDRSPIKSPVYKMHASNSPIRMESQNKIGDNNLDHQIENVCSENISQSSFGEDKNVSSVAKQSPKVYVRRDLLQTQEKEVTVKLIRNYLPKVKQNSDTQANKKSCKKYSTNNNKDLGYLDNSSVVKTLDFDGNKKINKVTLTKSDLFELEAKCEYQVGDLAWAKMGTYPYWPCIVTRDPVSGMFVKKKLFGRIDRDVIHVTFFGDNGRRSWIVDNMLRNFLGQLEFEAARDQFTSEAKKKDPRSAAFFVSEKKLPQWRISVEEAETLLREPKRLRIDLLNDMLNKTVTVKTTPKGSRKVSRTDSDVSLSESLYDTLFSEEDTKTHDIERAKRPRNKSLDVSEVVTACLDNMAAKTGITKIQKQSHMDRWLQKAKSKTPEKSQLKSQTNSHNHGQERRKSKVKRIKKEPDLAKSFPFTMSDNESLNEVDSKLLAHQNEHDYSVHCSGDYISQSKDSLVTNLKTPDSGVGIISKVKSVANISNDTQNVKVIITDDCIDFLDAANESNGVCDIVVEDGKVFNDGKSNNQSTISKASNEKNKPFVDLTKFTTCESNDVRVNGDEQISTRHLNNTDLTRLDNPEVSETSKSDTKKKGINFLREDHNTPSTLLQTGSIIDLNYEEDSIADSTCNSNEDLGEKKLQQTPEICDDDVTFTEDQDIQYVNIAKTVISDKLVGNIVDSNKIEFINDINEISTYENFTVNVDCDLKIPETDGNSNKPNIIDDYIKVNNHDDTESSTYTIEFCEASDIFEDKSEIVVHNKDFALTLSNSVVGSLNNLCPEAPYGDSNKKTEKFKAKYLEHEYVSSHRVSHENNEDIVTNGFARDKDDSLGTDTSSNCNLYLSSEDEDRSVSSTATDLDKYKTKFVKKNHKHITLQDALVNQDLDVIVMDGLEKSNMKNNIHEDMDAIDDGSQNTSADSERSLTDSNLTCYSDSKSLYSETQTETTVATETTSTMDIDESTYDSLSKNETKSISIETEIGYASKIKASSQVNLCEERAIIDGDELRLTPHGLQVITENCMQNDVDVNKNVENKVKADVDADTESVISTDSEISCSKRKMRWKTEKPNIVEKKRNLTHLENPDFLKYMELKQDAIYDEHPELSQEGITTYLYNTWLYEENLKTDTKKTDDMESANMVKGLESEPVRHQKKVKKRMKVEKEKDYEQVKGEKIVSKQKSKRRTVRQSYNEEYSDIEEDLEVFSIPKPKDVDTDDAQAIETAGAVELEEEVEKEIDEVEEYFARLTEPKPNVFKGLLREKVCDICEKPGSMIKCKGCSSMFHLDCVSKQTKVVEVQIPMKGRKKKKKFRGRKSKLDENGLDESQSDEKEANIPDDLASSSTENYEPEPYIVANADDFETQLAVKMKELLGEQENAYDAFSSDEELDWSDAEVGKCELVDIKLRKKRDDLVEYSDFKCNNCQKHDAPVCFVCRRAESPKSNALHRQRCQVAQCNRYYHLECLEHWPQTQFNSGDSARYNKKINEYFEALTCPRHVCHTCVSDDPRGCKTRFSADKLARCVRCPATYHTFTKCLPAGSQILTGSHIICPRHHEHRPGKIPCHVNTGWCFICALGGTLICCEYCPTSFHAECLNIKPPEGGYMCEDCETGRLPLYGEMVWVKLGHYRWWPGIILHPCEIPENILAVKHSPGEFVVRFFGQYDHYWVNRGRVFPFQEGDSGKISSQKSKIDAAFTMAMEHAQRACEILKTAPPNDEESIDIASSLLPPHFVRLRTNKPCGALCGRRADAESSLTQCECSPSDEQPCGPYTHCLNRMLLTECGPTCRAGERCHNRAFEKRLYPKLVPYRTPYRGWGLKTLEEIKAGQFVIEYVGELIDEEEFQRRMRRKQEIRDENFYFLTLDKERMIDAGPKGNLARFMNHCCEPNCETQKWTVLGDVRVGLFALYDIPANSEVTFNYNLESAGIEKKRCLCGAKRCSGYIGAKLKQAEPPKKPKRPYNKKRKVEDSPSASKVKPKAKLGRPPKPKELTDIEKDLLIIKNATSGISSDSDCSGRLSSIESMKELKASKRKRVGQSTEEPSSDNSSPSTKKLRVTEEQSSEVCD